MTAKNFHHSGWFRSDPHPTYFNPTKYNFKIHADSWKCTKYFRVPRKTIFSINDRNTCGNVFLGIRRGFTGEQLKKILDHSLRPVGMILLVIASGGVIRWMLQDSGLGTIIGPALEKSGLPLILIAFLIALLVRASVGSSIVAMTMASGVMATMPAVMATSMLYRAAMCCAICGGATALSHVNDAGFWLVGTFLEIDEKTTLKSWTIMETLIGITSLIIALIVSIFA
mgnify:CR=1 FL=1